MFNIYRVNLAAALTAALFFVSVANADDTSHVFAKEAFSANPIVLTSDADDAELIELSKFDHADFVYNDDKEMVAIWVPVADIAEAEIKKSKNIAQRERPGRLEVLVRLEKQPIDGSHLVAFDKILDERKTPGISFRLNEEGAKRMKKNTAKLLKRFESSETRPLLGILINGKLYSAPTLQVEIGDSGVISFSRPITNNEVEKLSGNIDKIIKTVKESPVWAHAEKDDEWKPLFDGKTLNGWNAPSIGGEGKVEVKDGAIELPMGATLTGIRYEKPFPKTNYEISYEARKTMGSDFFAALTFPVGHSHLSFITGGWGGGLVGISNLDGCDASNNETAKFLSFEKGKWYRFRIRVGEGKVQCWIIDESIKEDTEKKKREEMVVDIVTLRRRIGLRSESDLMKPLGLASWVTTGQVRDVRYRLLTAEESDKLKRDAEEYAKKFQR